jgi:hypothetical protein
VECSSRMKGNFQVRFLAGWHPAMGAGYSAEMRAEAILADTLVFTSGLDSVAALAAKQPIRTLTCTMTSDCFVEFIPVTETSSRERWGEAVRRHHPCIAT